MMNTNKRSSSNSNSCMDDDDEEVALPGFRFHPTDEELVGFYLRRKVDKKPLSIELIKQVDIYKYDPWDLPSMLFTSALLIIWSLFFLWIHIYLFILTVKEEEVEVEKLIRVRIDWEQSKDLIIWWDWLVLKWYFWESDFIHVAFVINQDFLSFLWLN